MIRELESDLNPGSPAAAERVVLGDGWGVQWRQAGGSRAGGGKVGKWLWHLECGEVW